MEKDVLKITAKGAGSWAARAREMTSRKVLRIGGV